MKGDVEVCQEDIEEEWTKYGALWNSSVYRVGRGGGGTHCDPICPVCQEALEPCQGGARDAHVRELVYYALMWGGIKSSFQVDE